MDIDVGKLKRSIRKKIDSLEPEFVEWHNALVWALNKIEEIELEAEYIASGCVTRSSS